MTKTCKKCGEEHTLEQFHRLSRGLHGRRSVCRWCVNEADRARYHANREKAVARVAAYNKAHPEKHAAAERRYRARHPNKKKAHRAVEKALKHGLLQRTCCRGCGAGDEIEAHHHSYAPEHWLDVIWLCSACHMALHRSPRAKESHA
jgi:hypothetical protein